MTKDETRRVLNPPASLIPCTKPLGIQNFSVPCAVNRELTTWDLIMPPGPWNMTPAHSPGAAFNRPRVEQHLPRGHFVPFPPCVSGRLGTLGPRTCPKSHIQQSQLRYQASVVSITTPKPVGDNGQQAVPQCQPRLLKDTVQSTWWPSWPFSHCLRFSSCSVSSTFMNTD